MSKIYVMIGLPASGKSTIAKNVEGGIIFSSDTYRAKMYGSEEIQGNPRDVFNNLYHDIHMELKRNPEAVIVLDATNINRKDRRQICDIAKKYGSRLIGVVMKTPLQVCIERNYNRKRIVPIDAIIRMVSRFEYPLYEEGFDEIQNIPCWEKNNDVDDVLKMGIGFDQKNEHHSSNLYDHAMNAVDFIFVEHGVKCWDLMDAAKYHDIGKIFTQTGPDEKGNCHYMGHANWSAYLYMCSRKFDPVVCKLINYHMIPYLHEWEKFKKKFGNEPWNFIEDLEKLHEADVNAH